MRTLVCILFFFAAAHSDAFAFIVKMNPQFSLDSNTNPIIETTKSIINFQSCSVEVEIQQKDANIDSIFSNIPDNADFEFVKVQIPLNISTLFPKTGVMWSIKKTPPPGLDSPNSYPVLKMGAYYYNLSYGYTLFHAETYNSLSNYYMVWEGNAYAYYYMDGSWTNMGAFSFPMRHINVIGGEGNELKAGAMTCISSSGCRVDYVQGWFY